MTTSVKPAVSSIDSNPTTSDVRIWEPILYGALAGGMGWGIRGQYGHETGAAMAGLLTCLALAFLFCRGASAGAVARAVAWGAVGWGIGGTETYGQTIGLTQSKSLIGNWDALRWGMLGLGIKGALWIGFGAAFFGMGLGGVRHRPRTVAWLMLAMVVAGIVGFFALNFPFDVKNHRLPPIYFSETWEWRTSTAPEPKPRFEVWGALLFAYITLLIYLHRAGDKLGRNLALWGLLGGFIGFPLGQCIQAYYNWNWEIFQHGFWPKVNYWNFMETTFGATMGGTVGLGLWLNRAKIAPKDIADEDRIMPELAGALFATHVFMLILVEFQPSVPAELLYDNGLLMAVIPLIALAGVRWWGIAQALPVTMIIIAGKTLRNLGYEEKAISLPLGWVIYILVPLAVFVFAAIKLGRASQRNGAPAGRAFLKPALLLCAWTYFLLNYAFFRFPWPWAEWTGRTPNAIIYMICVAGLTWLALRKNSELRMTNDERQITSRKGKPSATIPFR